uniref:Uncharacterized protein n=1 Tax=Megaviridae environmental sample TaxID=1737588 RepID=A0A5J6VJ54_9VIRU|nr:MAG: hypothetical protein [Megaviridae environmental sample]
MPITLSPTFENGDLTIIATAINGATPEWNGTANNALWVLDDTQLATGADDTNTLVITGLSGNENITGSFSVDTTGTSNIRLTKEFTIDLSVDSVTGTVDVNLQVDLDALISGLDAGMAITANGIKLTTDTTADNFASITPLTDNTIVLEPDGNGYKTSETMNIVILMNQVATIYVSEDATTKVNGAALATSEISQPAIGVDDSSKALTWVIEAGTSFTIPAGVPPNINFTIDAIARGGRSIRSSIPIKIKIKKQSKLSLDVIKSTLNKTVNKLGMPVASCIAVFVLLKLRRMLKR